jgi:hypothetical protein
MEKVNLAGGESGIQEVTSWKRKARLKTFILFMLMLFYMQFL